jgi:hypothetical protein
MLPGSIGPSFINFSFSCVIFRSSFIMVVFFNTDSNYSAIGIKAQKKAAGKPIGSKKYQLSLTPMPYRGASQRGLRYKKDVTEQR